MKQHRTLLVLGLWLIIEPFLGFPDSLHIILVAATGWVLVFVSILYLYHDIQKKDASKTNSVHHNNSSHNHTNIDRSRRHLATSEVREASNVSVDTSDPE